MKINSGFHSLQKKIPVTEPLTTQGVQNKGFSDIMQQNGERNQREQIAYILQQIQSQAERLTHSMTIRELRRYKLLVKQFLEQTVRKGVGIKNTRGWDRRGRTRRYKLIEEVDGHLLEMTDDLLVKEKGRVDILNKVGEIRGLLINLTF